MSRSHKALLAVLTLLWLGFIAWPFAVMAGDVTLTWKNPTLQQTCTRAGTLDNLAGTKIYQLVADIPDPITETFTLTGLKSGDYEFVATSYTDTGATSRLSGSATKAVTALTVSDDRAYVVAKINDGFITVVAGTVPIGTECIEDQTVNGKYAVPRGSVSWTGTVRDTLVVAECQ